MSQLVATTEKSVYRQLRDSPYVFGLSVTQFASLGGFLFGYDQGVVSGVLKMETFGALFPRVYTDSSFKGWFVSTLLLLAWFGSLINGPIADRFGRKGSILAAVLVFILGSALQAAASTTGVLFAGRAVAGIAVGMLTMIVPMYMSEVSTPGVRGTLVALQQLSITIGILISYWLEYGTQYIGGLRCDPDIPYSGPGDTFDPYKDVGPNGCTGQSAAAWRVPFALQIAPALILGIGMLFYPESPRFYLMCQKEDKALQTLAKLRRLNPDDDTLRREYLAIKSEVLFDESVARDKFPGKSGVSLNSYQLFVGINAIIYYAPTIFGQLGLSGNATSLLATGLFGVINTLSTFPALILIDKVGRRPLVMCGAVGMGTSLIIIAAILGAYGDLQQHKAAGWAGIVFIYIYDINFAYSLGPVGWVLPSEIFNLSNRSKAMAITCSSTWMSNFIIGLVTPDMLDNLKWGTYVFFAVFCAIAVAFTYFFVPETKGKSLEDMDIAFNDTAAHEEKIRLFEIAASLGLTDTVAGEKLNTDAETQGEEQKV
ncbi:hypothetical protein K4F52_000721 [Lecanicillium sp. MT-2017a]|nr:hypothetical protein K4F52_000721 [Lecanicillium sp. MT-2017a]